MPEFQYARGRVVETIQYISEEMKEFNAEYASKTREDYQNDKRLQKLIDRTVENILTAFIEVCGTILSEEGTGVDSYGDAIKKAAQKFKFSEKEQENLARLAVQRNRLAHRYLNFRWEAIKAFKAQSLLIVKLITSVLGKEKEERKQS
jgi:uncharacterized protein YutE (UPF0331/DUF86 family)